MIDLMDYGYRINPETTIPDGLIPARIVEVRRELYKAVCAHGEVSAHIPGAFFHEAENRSDFPAVGDFVLLRPNDSGSCIIERLLPRTSKFSRADFSGHAAGYVNTVLEQVVAANFDYVFILSSLNRDFNINRITRYLIQARQSGGYPAVILTKADLCENPEEQIRQMQKAAPGADVIALSALTGLGLELLESYLKPRKTIVFLGMSGVGKSSLLNVLAGEELMVVKQIRADDARGRHTTTHRQLIMLPSGAMIIDTPGMRELGMWDASQGLGEAFYDVEQYFGKCKFKDCKHRTEPGCAVKAAIENGELSQERWSSYLSLKREAKFSDDKGAYLRQKQQWHKEIAKWSKQKKKDGEIVK